MLALGRLRKRSHEFRPRLGYIVKLCFQKKKKSKGWSFTWVVLVSVCLECQGLGIGECVPGMLRPWVWPPQHSKQQYRKQKNRISRCVRRVISIECMLILLKLYLLLFQDSAWEQGDRSYRSRVQFLSFHLCMGPKDGIQADRLIQQMSLRVEPSLWLTLSHCP